MINKIRSYIDHAFEGIPQSKNVIELKDELLSNLIAKYMDQLAMGKTELEAYNAAIAGIGDLSELVESVREPYSYASIYDDPNYDRSRKALFLSISIGLYILSPFMVMLFTINFGSPILGIFFMFVCIALATGLIVYYNVTKPKYTRQDDSMVEEFKEWRFKTESQKAAYRSFVSAYWGFVVVIYLAISFLFDAWAVSWLIFVAAPAILNVVKGIYQLRSDRNEW